MTPEIISSVLDCQDSNVTKNTRLLSDELGEIFGCKADSRTQGFLETVDVDDEVVELPLDKEGSFEHPLRICL